MQRLRGGAGLDLRQQDWERRAASVGGDQHQAQEGADHFAAVVEDAILAVKAVYEKGQADLAEEHNYRIAAEQLAMAALELKESERVVVEQERREGEEMAKILLEAESFQRKYDEGLVRFPQHPAKHHQNLLLPPTTQKLAHSQPTVALNPSWHLQKTNALAIRNSADGCYVKPQRLKAFLKLP